MMLKKEQKLAAQNVLEFYYLANQLKEVVRTGWKQWNVSVDRRESVAEHIFGTCMLAIAIHSEYTYEIDIKKVMMMLVVHETEEIIISDIAPFDGVSPEEKSKMGHEAIKKIFSILKNGYTYEELILEFDERTTLEAKFAYMCDKLEADLMSLYYDKNGEVTLENASEFLKNNKEIVKLSDNGNKSMGACFYLYENMLNRLDTSFTEILEVAWDSIQ